MPESFVDMHDSAQFVYLASVLHAMRTSDQWTVLPKAARLGHFHDAEMQHARLDKLDMHLQSFVDRTLMRELFDRANIVRPED